MCGWVFVTARVFLWRVCRGPLKSISIYNDLSSIMLNATDRIKVVDVNSIQNAGQKRQQCPLSFKKHLLIKLLKMQYPSSGEGWPARGAEEGGSAVSGKRLTRPDLLMSFWYECRLALAPGAMWLLHSAAHDRAEWSPRSKTQRQIWDCVGQEGRLSIHHYIDVYRENHSIILYRWYLKLLSAF